MEKYFGFSAVTIKNMLLDRRQSLDETITEMIAYPKDGQLYIRAEAQARELADLINEWAFRNDDTISK